MVIMQIGIVTLNVMFLVQNYHSDAIICCFLCYNVSGEAAKSFLFQIDSIRHRVYLIKCTQ